MAASISVETAARGAKNRAALGVFHWLVRCSFSRA